MDSHEETYNEYLVVWRIEVTARSPEEAARIAHLTMTDPESTATVFEISEIKSGAGISITVDLQGTDYADGC